MREGGTDWGGDESSLGSCSRAFEQVDLVGGETLDWIRADMPHVICRGDSAALRGPTWTTPFLESVKNVCLG